MTKTNDPDAKIQKMQALLERWVKTYQWQEQSVVKNTPVYYDTRKFLKEAKEVADG